MQSTALAVRGAPASAAGLAAAPRRRAAAGARRVQTAAVVLPAGLALAAAAGGLFLIAEELKHQEWLAHEASEREACPSCNGRGLEPCHCRKWSDGDAGCASCSHTGFMRCRSCGGSGRAVPIKATVRR